jgi:hypothetical protein
MLETADVLEIRESSEIIGRQETGEVLEVTGRQETGEVLEVKESGRSGPAPGPDPGKPQSS